MPARIPLIRDEDDYWDDIVNRLNANVNSLNTNPWSHEVGDNPPKLGNCIKLDNWVISCVPDGAPKLVPASYGLETKQEAIDVFRRDTKANIAEDYKEINDMLSAIERQRKMLAKLDKLEKEL
jgi:hypothetical protein